MAKKLFILPLPILDQDTGELIFPIDSKGRPVPVDEFILKVSKNMKVFVSRIVRDGAAQRAFTENIGHKTGQCVAGKVRKGMTVAEIHDIVKGCAPKKGTVTYTVKEEKVSKYIDSKGRPVIIDEFIIRVSSRIGKK